MTTFSFAIGDTVEIRWQPELPVKVDDRMYEAVTRLRSGGSSQSRRGTTLTMPKLRRPLMGGIPFAASAELSTYSRTTVSSAESPRWPHRS